MGEQDVYKRQDISPAADPAAWTYTLADGTALSPDADGRFALPAADTVVYCTRTLDGLQPAGLLNPDTCLLYTSRCV